MATGEQGSECIQSITKLIDRYGDAFEIEIISTIGDILNAPVHLDERQTARRKLTTDKAPGIDLIPAEFYKYSNFYSYSTQLWMPVNTHPHGGRE